jgi:hypothetical protein
MDFGTATIGVDVYAVHGGMEMSPANNPGFGKQQKSYSVRITIIGGASPRWRGAASKVTADHLNEQLSKARAANVQRDIEHTLRSLDPDIKFDAGVSTSGSHPSGIEVGSYGVGSREALVQAKGDRLNNDEMHRSVVVTLDFITTRYGQTGVSLQPKRYSAICSSWHVTIRSLDLFGMGVGIVGGLVNLDLRNGYSNKIMHAQATLSGGGAGPTPLSLLKGAKSNPAKLLKPVGEEVSIYTDEPMGFDDFNDDSHNMLRIEEAKASLGVTIPLIHVDVGLGASYGMLSFLQLGRDAQGRVFEHTFGVTGGLSLRGVVMSGRMHLIGDNPGDWYEEDGGTQVIPTQVDKTQTDSIILSFKTGSAVLGDSEPARLRKFVTEWAGRKLLIP